MATKRIENKEEAKKARLEEALSLLDDLDKRGFVRYGIQQHTGITHNTMSYWMSGIWCPSRKVLKRLVKFHQGVVNGKIKPEKTEQAA